MIISPVQQDHGDTKNGSSFFVCFSYTSSSASSSSSSCKTKQVRDIRIIVIPSIMQGEKSWRRSLALQELIGLRPMTCHYVVQAKDRRWGGKEEG